MARTIRFCIALTAATASLAIGCGQATEDAAAAKLPSSFYGVIPQGPVKAGEYDRMKRGKVGTFRVLISWSAVQPSATSGYRWDALDAVFTNLAMAGIRPLPFFYGSPSWIANERNRAPVRTKKQRKAWKKFVKATGKRYGPKGDLWDELAVSNPTLKAKPARVWENWNEVNSSFFFGPKPSPKRYARLLQITEIALHRSQPKAKIIFGGMFGEPFTPGSISAWKFLNKVYKVGGIKKTFDYVGIHPYGGGVDAIKEHFRKIRKVMIRNGDRRAGTWITEMGWGSDSANSNSELVKSPRGQARLLGQSLDLMAKRRKAWGLKGMIWYSLSDPVEVPEHCQNLCASSGLLKSNGTAKPAWREFTDRTGGKP